MPSFDKLNLKIIKLVEDCILISINASNKEEIIFDVISKETGEWCRYYIYIREATNFYYQRYETSFQRTGFVNLKRIDFHDKKSEWIKEANQWGNPFTKENGIEFKLYDGTILRFVGSQLNLDHSFVEGPADSIEKYSDGKPDHIEQSKATVVLNESFSKTPAILYEKELKTEVMEETHIVEDISNTTIESVYKEDTIAPEYDEVLSKLDNLTDNIETIENEDNQSFSMDLESEDTVSTEREGVEYETSTSNIELIPENREEVYLRTSDDTDLIQKEKGEVEEEEEEEEEITPIDIDKKLEDTETEVITSDDTEVILEDIEEEDVSLLNQITEYAIPDQANISTPNSKSINLVNGVTDQNKTQIENLGFETIEKLSKAKIAKLSSIKGIGRRTARKIIQSANNLVDYKTD